MNQNVLIYTDGSSIGNPGPGGLGIVMIFGEHRKEIAQGYRYTTNNRMELLAVITALNALKRKDLKIIIHTDSEYVINAITKNWLEGWITKKFKNIKNSDLWKKYIECSKNQIIEFRWIKGHAGDKENERCDYLARTAALNPSLVDEEYEKLSEIVTEQKKLF